MKKRLLIAFLFFIGSYNSIAQNSINFDPPCVTPGDPITISVQDPSGNDLNVYWINQPNITFLTPNTPTGRTQTTVIFNTGASNLIALDVNTFIPVINTPMSPPYTAFGENASPIMDDNTPPSLSKFVRITNNDAATYKTTIKGTIFSVV